MPLHPCDSSANAGGKFFYKGIVTGIRAGQDGDVIYVGRHAAVPERPRKSYVHDWALPLDQLRLAPNVLNLLSARMA